MPVRRPVGLGVTAVVLALLSLAIGLRIFTPSKPGEAADGAEPSPPPKAGEAADGNSPPKKKPEPPAEPKAPPKSKPELVPWPPESLAFAGNKAGEEWSANGLRMKFCW